MQWLWRSARAAALSFFLAFLVVGLLATFVLRSAAARGLYLQNLFEDESGRSVFSLMAEVGSSLARPKPTKEVYRFLILGKDEVEGSNRPTVLTDTILVVSWRPSEGKVRLISLPRDIYIPEESAKINTLYRKGQEQSPANPAAYPARVISEMLGVPIDSTVTFSLSDVEALIDLAGGVDIDVQHGFTDERFPLGGVDVTKVTDPKLLYETIIFEPGLQHMDGARALKFMRSRKSYDATEGSDDARARRQQQVIAALAARFKDPMVWANPVRLGALYRWYADRVASQMPLGAIVTLGRSWQQNPVFPQVESIPISTTAYPRATDSATLFVHPPESKYAGQWVYEVVDKSWGQVRDFVELNKF